MDARERLVTRLMREFIPITEHGDFIKLARYEAEALADIIAEYVAAAIRTPSTGEET